MNIHEYQAKALLRSYGAPVSDGRVVLKADEAKTAAGELDGPLWVVKAQIHAGGRGKGSFKEADAGEKGGVRLTKSVQEAAEEAKKMLGRTLVTKQTGPAGKQVNRIYIEDGQRHREASTLPRPPLVDRATSRIVELRGLHRGRHGYRGSRRKQPREDPQVFSVDPATGYLPIPRARIAFNLGLQGKQVKQCVQADGHALQGCSVEKDMEPCSRSTR